ncbi:MAG: hypothetical protein KDA79_17690 [Planctomycetaceae bacterium]|nr:hypothetical protein [Planctomycetaceae bacterium]
MTDLETLRRNVGKTVTVYGQVSRTGKSSSGINFLNFANTELTIVCLKDDAAKFKDGQPADKYRDAEIEVTGEVERFRGKLQVALTAPEHIRRIEADQPDVPSIELKQVGKDHWRSPAGLNYKGRDPDGRSRLEHVLRHAKDDPRRDGPHGVFDGGRDGALAAIDQAWQQIQKQRVRPDVEGSRAAYTVRLNRKVGYLGGRTGASRRNPALYRVLIVVERDTSNVVTAYPK